MQRSGPARTRFATREMGGARLFPRPRGKREAENSASEMPLALVLAGPAEPPPALVRPQRCPPRAYRPDGTAAVPPRSTLAVSLRGGSAASRRASWATSPTRSAPRAPRVERDCVVVPAPAGNSCRGAVAEAERVVDCAFDVARGTWARCRPEAARVRKIPSASKSSINN
jgi:hypothetical protein